jgi:hypothetical protein
LELLIVAELMWVFIDTPAATQYFGEYGKLGKRMVLAEWLQAAHARVMLGDTLS